MGDQVKIDYFYGDEPDNFCFYRVPKVLYTKKYFQGLSSDAKVLYGLMLDMTESSRANRWVDDENRVFIQFSIQRAMAYLDCGKDKAIKLFAELDTEKGIGLIERIDRGQGKADLIYVKSFELPADAEDNDRLKKLKEKNAQKNPTGGFRKPPVDKSDKVVGKTDRSKKSGWSPYDEVVGKYDQSEKPTTSTPKKVVGKIDRSDYPTSRDLNFRPQEVVKSDPNKTNLNNNNFINNSPVRSYYENDEWEERIDYSTPIMVTMENLYGGSVSPAVKDDRTDRDMYIEILRDQIGYERLCDEEPYCYQRDMIDGIINVIADIATIDSPTGNERVNGRNYPQEIVRSRLLKIDYPTVCYVLDRIRENGKEIRHVRNYLMTALYNARDEMYMAMQESRPVPEKKPFYGFC